MRHGGKRVCLVSMQQQRQALTWLAYQQFISQVEPAFKPDKDPNFIQAMTPFWTEKKLLQS